MSFAKTKDGRTIERAGNALFGTGWDAVRPMVQGDRAFNVLNAPMKQQLDWLKGSCS